MRIAIFAKSTLARSNVLWGLLKDGFAQNKGEIDYRASGLKIKEQTQLKTHVKKIRKQMKRIFGIDEDPFKSYRETNSYSLKMTIRDE